MLIKTEAIDRRGWNMFDPFGCNFCRDVNAGKYIEQGITPGRPQIAYSGEQIENAARYLHDSGRRDLAKGVLAMASAGAIGVPMKRNAETGLYLPDSGESNAQAEQPAYSGISRRDILYALATVVGAAILSNCGGGGNSNPPPPPPPPPPSKANVALKILDANGLPVTNEVFRMTYGLVDVETTANTAGVYTNQVDADTSVADRTIMTGQPKAGGTTPWYRMTRTDRIALPSGTVTLADSKALARFTEAGNTTLMRHLLNLYRFMTSTDVAPLTKLRKYPSFTNPNGVEVNLNHILGVDQYVNALRNTALPAWAAGLAQGKKLYSEVTQNPPIGLYFTYANRGTSMPRFNTILKPLGTDSSGNQFVTNFEIEVNTVYNVDQSWLENVVHELGHALICLFREDPDSLRTHAMSGGGIGRTIQPIEFGERDSQVLLSLAFDTGLYPLETS